MNYSQVLEIASCTDPGMVRSHNEDSIASDPANGLVVLADGMGGYNAGEVASGMATTVITTEIQQLLAKVQPFRDRRGNQGGRRRADDARAGAEGEHLDLPGGAEPAAVRGHGHDAGRVPVLRQPDDRRRISATRACTGCATDKFSQVTRDHSLLQEQIDSGIITAEQAKHAQHKNLVTKALGIDPTVEPEIHEYEHQAGRRLPALLGRPVRHGGRRGHGHDACRRSAAT